MDILAYIIRAFVMMVVTWSGVRLIGKKSISEMTSYDMAGLMLLTTIAAEPLVYKIPFKATVGVYSIVAFTLIIGTLSLTKLFYNFDSRPLVIVSDSKIIEKELKIARMNIPLLMSELRQQGYQDLSDVKYALLEPSVKISVIPKSQIKPVTLKDMGISASPTSLSFPIIVDGKLYKENLTYINKNETWLITQLKNNKIDRIKDVLYAQIDSSGNLFVDMKRKNIKLPNMY